jgi:hypothetical protein
MLTRNFADEFIPATWPRSSAGAAAATSAAAGTATSAADDIEPFLGHYLATESKTRSFALRVGSWFGGVDVVRMGKDGIGVAGLGPFHRVGSYLYEDAKGLRLAFAELPVGRFVAIGLSPGAFRKTSTLESPLWTVPLLIAATLGLVSALARLRARTPARLRRLAAVALIGYLLVLAGLLLEWQFGTRLSVVEGSIVLPALWRAGLYLGAVMLLLGAVKFVVPRDRSLSIAGYGHGMLIAASGLSVVAVLILWRVVGVSP